MFSFVAEFFALVILCAIIATVGHRETLRTSDQNLFFSSVVLTAVSILLDGLCIATLENAASLPRWVNYADNTLYYIVCFLMVSCYTSYIISCMTSRIGAHRGLTIASRVNYGTCAVVIALILSNPWTDLMFDLDAESAYVHGPLWTIGYIQVFLMVVVVCACAFHYRATLHNLIARIMRVTTPVIAVLVVFQVAYPSITMNGLIATSFAIILLLTLQLSSNETDALTGLGNRFAFVGAVRAWNRTGRPRRIVAVHLEHIDGINSAYGVDVGNHIVTLLGDAAHAICKESGGEAFRLSPMMFALTLGSGGVADDALPEYVARRIPKSMSFGNIELPIQTRIIDYAMDDACKPSEMIERIEQAKIEMRSACTQVFRIDAAFVERLEEKKRLTRYLEKSIDEDRFEMWVQPIYDVHTGRFLRGESLMRLRGPDGDFIPPDHFVPIAEQSTLILDMSSQTKGQLFTFLGQHPTLPLDTVSINITTQQLSDEDFPRRLGEELARNGIPTSRIALEITERMFTSENDCVSSTLDTLAGQGYRFMMDDFGTGYSNFAGMLAFPFDAIKIDKSLVYAAQNDDGAMLRTIVDFLHDNDYLVVAEGIETEEQAKRVAACGIDLIQGYYYAHPMPLEELPGFLEQQG